MPAASRLRGGASQHQEPPQVILAGHTNDKKPASAGFDFVRFERGVKREAGLPAASHFARRRKPTSRTPGSNIPRHTKDKKPASAGFDFVGFERGVKREAGLPAASSGGGMEGRKGDETGVSAPFAACGKRLRAKRRRNYVNCFRRGNPRITGGRGKLSMRGCFARKRR